MSLTESQIRTLAETMTTDGAIATAIGRMHRTALAEVGRMQAGPASKDWQHIYTRAQTLHEVMNVVRQIMRISNGGE